MNGQKQNNFAGQPSVVLIVRNAKPFDKLRANGQLFSTQQLPYACTIPRMIETLTIITLCVLYLVFFRPGKTPSLKNPLVIDRPGKYHVTLAPHLNLAQPFVEAIAQRLMESSERSGDSGTLFFKVTDKHVTFHGHDIYLLAVTQRDGILIFQAAAPEGDSDHLQTISEFAQSVLARFPLTGEPNVTIDQEIVNAAQQVASAKRVEIAQIS
jgi:hypothetical protein